MNRVAELRSVSEAERERMPFPSPLTPAYVKASLATKRQTFGDEDVEDACRSFENYLVEMMIEEGKVRDLADVEELLYCWKKLKCPVFVGLVCRFYGELCKDLFSPDVENTDVIMKGINPIVVYRFLLVLGGKTSKGSEVKLEDASTQ
ncbi:hypothetical protein DKX38_020307 [Salix brachista]|uniref:OVATE domain-containing protein n=1 Tax=Salix brachista TaxID=2182728 RepID=A0A5N5KIY1_9ROSI|nr:hypothetical protein DKX38_020307 [Salix brachista]